MMLRRNNRKPEFTPQVNGKPVEKQPKKKTLTKEEKNTIPQISTYDLLKK